MTAYKDPLINKLFDLIDADDGGAIKKFFYGDPLHIPKVDLPALVGVKDSTTISDETNAEDLHQVDIVLTLVVDIREYLKLSDSGDVHVAQQKLWDIMEGRDSNFKLKTSSICHIIRNNANLGNNARIDVDVPTVPDYGLVVGKRGENNVSWEANLSVPIFYTQLR